MIFVLQSLKSLTVRAVVVVVVVVVCNKLEFEFRNNLSGKGCVVKM